MQEAWSGFLQQQLTPKACSHLQREGWLVADGLLDASICQLLRAEIQVLGRLRSGSVAGLFGHSTPFSCLRLHAMQFWHAEGCAGTSILKGQS